MKLHIVLLYWDGESFKHLIQIERGILNNEVASTMFSTAPKIYLEGQGTWEVG